MPIAYLEVYHCYDNREVLHNLGYCLLCTGDQYEHPKIAELLTRENQAEIQVNNTLLAKNFRQF